ncbi:MAG: hypothetical protein FJ256_08100 [Phycisphaerae bacterium]|nr:hypothetical protein [Phycisphaerae bacterium]
MSQTRPQRTSQERKLVDELLLESHGLRMKYEDFSRFTEGQVAEFVLTKKRLNRELAELGERVAQLESACAHLEQQRDRLVGERGVAVRESERIAVELLHARGDITLLHDQRAMVQGELVRMTGECSALQVELAKRTLQRDRLRERVRALESSRAYRWSSKLRRILRRSR